MADKMIINFDDLEALQDSDVILVGSASDSFKAAVSLLKSTFRTGMVAVAQGVANAGKPLVVGSGGVVAPQAVVVDVDTTLTQTGQPADAKVLGDLIRDLREDVDELMELWGG